MSELDLEVPGENITDVWAYGDYAYLGTFDDGSCSLDYTGVHIVDIGDVDNPEKVSFIPAKPGTRNNDVKVNHIETRQFTGEIMIASNEACGSAFMPRAQSSGLAGPTGQGGITMCGGKTTVLLGDSEYGVPDPLSGEFPAGDGHVAVPNADGSLVLLGDEDFSSGQLTSFTYKSVEYPGRLPPRSRR